MSATEVTVGQYRRCVEAGVCSRPCNEWDRCTWNRPGFPWTENHAVNCVDWGQARTYAIWAGGDLATEAQWEYAAKGGEGYLHAGSDSLLDFGWYENTSGNSPKEVGLLNPNGYGLYDMSGNVWEWVLDERHPTYNGAPNQGETPWGEVPACCPICDKGSAARVHRGGSYIGNIMQTTVTARSTKPASYRHPQTGFRIKRTVAAANGGDSLFQGVKWGAPKVASCPAAGAPTRWFLWGRSRVKAATFQTVDVLFSSHGIRVTSPAWSRLFPPCLLRESRGPRLGLRQPNPGDGSHCHCHCGGRRVRRVRFANSILWLMPTMRWNCISTRQIQMESRPLTFESGRKSRLTSPE